MGSGQKGVEWAQSWAKYLISATSIQMSPKTIFGRRKLELGMESHGAREAGPVVEPTRAFSAERDSREKAMGTTELWCHGRRSVNRGGVPLKASPTTAFRAAPKKHVCRVPIV